MLNNTHILIPELFLALAISIELIIVAVYSKLNKQLSQNFKFNLITIISLFITSYLFLENLTTIETTYIALNSLKVDTLTQIVKAIICIIAAFILMLNQTNSKFMRLDQSELSIIISLSILGFLIIISANDLLILYLGIELYSLSLYILASIKRWNEKSTEAGLKYFVLGSLASGLFLFGSSVLYFVTGELSYEGLYTYLSSVELSKLTIVGSFFIIIALLFKMAAAPLHMWAPDVYDGAPTIITAFFATIPKFPLFVALLHLLYTPLYPLFETIKPLLIICAIFSMLIGSITGLNQIKIKRLMAYSSISHIGFILIGVGLGSAAGIKASFIYLFIYIISGLALFSTITLFFKNTDYITELAGFGKRNPIIALSLSLLLFSAAGVPPLAGFYSKFIVLYECLQQDLYFLALIAVISSTIALIYYIRITKWMFFKDSADYNIKIIADIIKPNETINIYALIIVGFILFLILSFLIYPVVWVKFANYLIITSLI